LAWHAYAIANSFRRAIAERKTNVVFTLLTVVIVGIYVIGNTYLYAVQHAAAVRSAWPMVSLSALALAVLAGPIAGWKATGFMLHFAFASWTATLPVGAAVRLQSAGVAALLVGAGEAVLLALSASAVCLWIDVEQVGIKGALFAFAFLLAFMGAVGCRLWLTARPSDSGGGSPDAVILARVRFGSDGDLMPRWRNQLFDLLAPIDQIKPRWIGRWVLDNRLLRQVGLDGAFLLIFSVFAAAASLVQGQAAPALGTGVLAAHAAFVISLRSHPLASSTLRCSPLSFTAAWSGIIRLPLALSLGWFVPLGLTAILAEPAQWILVVAGALALLLANGIYSVISANAPLFPKTTRIAHIVVLMMIAKGALEINVWVLLPIAAFVALMWRSARRRYRIYA